MSTPSISAEREQQPQAPSHFDWPLANDGERFIREQIASFLAASSFARTLSNRMRDETATDFFEWVDHIVISPGQEEQLARAGFVHDRTAETPNGELVYEHPRATLPRMMVRKGQQRSPSTLALKPEFIADFIACHN